MRILIIDGQGGKLGAQLVKAVLAGFSDAEVTAVGTNSFAASAMIKAGATRAATGENAVLVSCRKSDVILGPIGIVIADALCGEVTPAMAVAVGQADAVRILLPVNRCENLVAGVGAATVGELVDDALKKLSAIALR